MNAFAETDGDFQANELGSDARQFFLERGALCIRNAFTAAQVAELQAGIEQNLAQPSPRAKVASDADDPGWFFEDFCNWQDNPHYNRFIHETPLASIAQQLLGSQQIRLYHDHVLVKEPNTRQRTPWHQDQPYYNISGSDTISFWIPVDPVAKAATLEFVAGSHLGPWLMPRSFMDNQAKWFAEGTLADLPKIEEHREDFPILGWALQPGDMVCFNMLTLHASAGVDGNHRRRAFSVRMLGDDVRHAPRPWVTSPEFPGLRETLAEGAVMDHPLFPLLS